MNLIRNSYVATLLAIALLIGASASHAADDQQSRATVERVAHLFSSKSSIATVQMQIKNEDGQRDITMKIWSLGDKLLLRITSPQDQAGTAVLKEGSDVWYYLPKTNRTVKVPASMSMNGWMGSDFSIDDLVKGDFSHPRLHHQHLLPGEPWRHRCRRIHADAEARCAGGLGKNYSANSQSRRRSHLARFL